MLADPGLGADGEIRTGGDNVLTVAEDIAQTASRRQALDIYRRIGAADAARLAADMDGRQ